MQGSPPGPCKDMFSFMDFQSLCASCVRGGCACVYMCTRVCTCGGQRSVLGGSPLVLSTLSEVGPFSYPTA